MEQQANCVGVDTRSLVSLADDDVPNFWGEMDSRGRHLRVQAGEFALGICL